MAIVTPEATVWAALRLDLEAVGSPPESAPIDREYVAALIAMAETRLAAYIGRGLSDFIEDEEEVPEPLTQAVCLDVSCSYFNRLNPELPAAYFDLIAPWRVWSFGGAA